MLGTSINCPVCKRVLKFKNWKTSVLGYGLLLLQVVFYFLLHSLIGYCHWYLSSKLYVLE